MVPELEKLLDICRSCRLGNAHKLPFQAHFERASRVGELVHSDVVGKIEMSYLDDYQYACTLLDDHSRYTFIANL